MEILSGKRVLLIAPAYHNYISNIASAFERLGAFVESYSQDPTAIFCKNFYLSRLKKFSYFQEMYEREVRIRNIFILNSVKRKQFDHVVIVKGDLLTDDFLLTLKNGMPKANFVMYQWDSIKYFNYLNLTKYFNTVFSFDYADCIKNEQILYLPLFFSEEYAKIASIKDIEYGNDLFFLGYNHTIRVQKLFEMIDFFDEKKLKYSVNLMTTISDKIRLVINRRKINCFFYSLKFNQFSEKYIKSKAIIDVSPPHQSGLPMRIIEAVGANKKIVTTNYNIVNEKFYDPKLIFIWGKDNPDDLISFLNQEHKKANNENYSIEAFALNLIGSKELSS